MINDTVLLEKLKYLITINGKLKMFEVMNINMEFEYTDKTHTKLRNYDIDIKFDYHGPLDFDMYSFAHDIQRMSEKLRDILNEFVITEEGKIVSGTNSNCYTTEPMIFSIEYKADESHIFELGYKFHYENE